MSIQKQRGFSIIEVLIAIGIIAVIGIYTSNVLTRTYKTTSDTDLLSNLKKNGETAANIIGESIRMADAVVCYDKSQGSLLNNVMIIRDSAGKYTRFRFVSPVPPTGGPITQNGYIAREDNVTPQVKLDTFCQDTPNSANEVSITDKDLQSGVSIANGEFKRISGIEGKHAVAIKFEVSPGGGAVNSGAIVKIQTTIQVR